MTDPKYNSGRDYGIFKAAETGDIKSARLILASAPTNASAVNDKAMTPLHIAAQNGHKNMVDLLLMYNADVNAGLENNQSPLSLGISNCHKDVVESLLMHGVDPKKLGLSSPLHLAANVGDKAIVEVLLAAGADPNAADESKQTPLHVAAENGLADIVNILLWHGAAPCASDACNKTPIDLAELDGHIDLATFMTNFLSQDWSPYCAALYEYNESDTYDRRTIYVADSALQLLKDIAPEIRDGSKLLWSSRWDIISASTDSDVLECYPGGELFTKASLLDNLLNLLDHLINEEITSLEREGSNCTSINGPWLDLVNSINESLLYDYDNYYHGIFIEGDLPSFSKYFFESEIKISDPRKSEKMRYLYEPYGRGVKRGIMSSSHAEWMGRLAAFASFSEYEWNQITPGLRRQFWNLVDEFNNNEGKF